MLLYSKEKVRNKNRSYLQLQLPPHHLFSILHLIQLDNKSLKSHLKMTKKNSQMEKAYPLNSHPSLKNLAVLKTTIMKSFVMILAIPFLVELVLSHHILKHKAVPF